MHVMWACEHLRGRSSPAFDCYMQRDSAARSDRCLCQTSPSVSDLIASVSASHSHPTAQYSEPSPLRGPSELRVAQHHEVNQAPPAVRQGKAAEELCHLWAALQCGNVRRSSARSWLKLRRRAARAPSASLRQLQWRMRCRWGSHAEAPHAEALHGCSAQRATGCSTAVSSAHRAKAALTAKGCYPGPLCKVLMPGHAKISRASATHFCHEYDLRLLCFGCLLSLASKSNAAAQCAHTCAVQAHAANLLLAANCSATSMCAPSLSAS